MVTARRFWDCCRKVFTKSSWSATGSSCIIYISDDLKGSQQSNRKLCTFLARNNFSFVKIKTLKMDMKQVQYQHIKFTPSAKRVCADMLTVAAWTKNLKGEFVRQYDNKLSVLGSTVAPCSEQPQLPLCLVCSQIISNNAMKPSTLARHFHSK